MNVQRGMKLLPAPVSTLHLRDASWHFPISAGILMSAKASVPFVFTSVMVVVSSSHKGWSLQGTTTAPTWFRADAIPVPTWFRTAATLTSSMWGSSSVPTSWILFCLGLAPCPVEAHVVQQLLVSSWSSYPWPSSVPFCHMLGIGSPLQGRKLILGHPVLCSSCRSVVVSAAVVEVCVPCIDLSAGVLCGWHGRSWSCLVLRLPFHC